MKSISKLLLLAVALAAFAPASLFACATCFGQSDSDMAQGMNWGIFTLLGVIVAVLATIVGFFVHLIRKEAAADSTAPENPTEA